MLDKLRAIREEKAAEDRGFTLIELLVVVVIIGILVAIAIPIYLHYRQGAQKDSAQSDVRNAVPAIEQAFTDNGNKYPLTTEVHDSPCTNSGGSGGSGCTAITLGSTTDTINVSPGDTVTYTSDGTAYTVTAQGSDGTTTYSYTNSGASAGQITSTSSTSSTAPSGAPSST